MSTKPRKPYRPLAVLGFSKSGTVTKHQHELPNTSTEVAERVIAIGFAARMSEVGRPMAILNERPPEPADAMAQRSDGSRVGLQICEAIDPVWSARFEMSQGYPPAIRAAFPDLLEELRGFRVELMIPADEGPLPGPKQRDGKVVLEHLRSVLRELVTLSKTLERGRWRVRRSVILGVELTATLEHIHPSMDAEIYWQDLRCFTPYDDRLFVARTIFRKVEKRYAVGRAEQLWLVVFHGSSEFFLDGSADYQAARNVLAATDHPFREVWHFTPLPESIGGTGIAVQIWPPRSA